MRAAELASAAIAVARHRYGPARRFAEALGQALDGHPLSRQAVYLWETGTNRVPAAALILAADLVGMSVQDLLAAGARFASKECLEMNSPARAAVDEVLASATGGADAPAVRPRAGSSASRSP